MTAIRKRMLTTSSTRGLGTTNPRLKASSAAAPRPAASCSHSFDKASDMYRLAALLTNVQEIFRIFVIGPGPPGLSFRSRCVDIPILHALVLPLQRLHIADRRIIVGTCNQT